MRRLQSAPLNDIEFVLSDIHFHQQRRFTEYSGDVSGRMLGALNSFASLMGHEIPFLTALRKEIPLYQKADGHFGIDQDLEKQIQQERDMPILWGNGRTLLAMAEYCRDHDDPAFLESAEKLGDYIISTRAYFGKEENFTQVGGLYASGFTTCYPSWIDGLVALGEISGQRKYYEEARYIARLSLLDKEFAQRHSHGRLVAYRGMLDLDRLTGTHEFIPAVIAGCETIRNQYLLPTDGVPEIFDLTYSLDEGCSEADWIRVNLLLWQATGKTTYLDMAESTLCNHVIPNQLSNGGFGHVTYAPLRYGKETYPGGKIMHSGTESYWCCSMHVAQILCDIVRWSVLQSNEAFWITWLADVQAEFTQEGKKITVAIEKQRLDVWQVILKTPSKAKTILKLRVPGWADSILVDGEKCNVTGGWAEVPCDWTGQLKLKVQLPNQVRLGGAYQEEAKEDQPARVFYGSDLYGLPQVFVSKEFWPNTFVPEIVISNPVSNPEQIPILLKGPNDSWQQTRLIPLSQCPPGGRIVLFAAKRIDPNSFQQLSHQAVPAPEMGTPAEIMMGCDGDYEIYLNGEMVFQNTGWGSSPRVSVYTHQKKNVLVVKAQSKANRPALIGTIQTGNKILATHPDQVSVLPCPKEIPPSWLINPKQWQQKVDVTDLGGYGDGPWQHFPAQFAGTEARWIWPEQIQSPSDHIGWLFCFVFEIPEK
jgi:hypothetical protein